MHGNDDGFNADSTVDEREVSHYRELADRWWDISGPFWPLHRLNALRVDYLRRQIPRLLGRSGSRQGLDGVRVLDIGCGGGILSESMARMGAAVLGIDVVEKNIGVAKSHAETGLDVAYRLATASDLRRRGEAYDVVLNMEVVEHVADVESFMDDCCALVRPGGVLAVATINRTVTSYLFAIVGAEYVLGWLPRGTHRWARFRRPDEIERLASARGLDRRDAVGVKVNPFTRRFDLSRLMAVNYMMLFVRR